MANFVKNIFEMKLCHYMDLTAYKFSVHFLWHHFGKKKCK